MKSELIFPKPYNTTMYVNTFYFSSSQHGHELALLLSVATLKCYSLLWLPSSSDGKESGCNAWDPASIPGSGRSPGGGHGNHSAVLAWTTPWTEEPGALQSTESQRVRPYWSNLACSMHACFLKRLKHKKEDSAVEDSCVTSVHGQLLKQI